MCDRNKKDELSLAAANEEKPNITNFKSFLTTPKGIFFTVLLIADLFALADYVIIKDRTIITYIITLIVVLSYALCIHVRFSAVRSEKEEKYKKSRNIFQTLY